MRSWKGDTSCLGGDHGAKLLGTEYKHALGLLKQAEASFDSGRSYWLISQNGFNQIAFLALQRHLAASEHLASVPLTNRKGELLAYGVTLDARRRFSKQFPDIANCLRDVNARRNRIPFTHPYEMKTGKQSKYLSKQERDRLVGLLQGAYACLTGLMMRELS